jgi:hypothetical protein
MIAIASDVIVMSAPNLTVCFAEGFIVQT